MHIVIKDGFYTGLGHITPYCSIQWPRSFRHTAVNSTCQHHCSSAYQVFCSNPHPLDCSICTFHSTLKWKPYIHEVFYIPAGAQIRHLLSVLSRASLCNKKNNTAMTHSVLFLEARLPPYEVSQNSQVVIIQKVFFSCQNTRFSFKCRSKTRMQRTQGAHRAQCYCSCYATL